MRKVFYADTCSRASVQALLRKIRPKPQYKQSVGLNDSVIPTAPFRALQVPKLRINLSRLDEYIILLWRDPSTFPTKVHAIFPRAVKKVSTVVLTWLYKMCLLCTLGRVKITNISSVVHDTLATMSFNQIQKTPRSFWSCGASPGVVARTTHNQ